MSTDTMDPRFLTLKQGLPPGEPQDWSIAWRLRTLAAAFQTGNATLVGWPEGDQVQIDLLDTADWIEEAARRLSK